MGGEIETEWRRMDPERLEWEYNPRLTVGDPAPYFRAFQERSEQVRQTLTCHPDIRYGDGVHATMDVYPAPAAGAPVHLFLHGGYWRSQDKRDYAFIAGNLVPAGITTVVANYDLCPATSIAAIETQVVACVDYLRRNARRWQADPSRLSVSGHSAGGQLAVRLLLQRGEYLQGVTAISGLFDLEPVVHTSINQDLRLDVDEARRRSPMHWPLRASRVPLHLVVGADESAEFRRQSAAFADRASADGLRCSLDVIPETNHFTVLAAWYGRRDIRALLPG